jgi:hypothetical protein
MAELPMTPKTAGDVCHQGKDKEFAPKNSKIKHFYFHEGNFPKCDVLFLYFVIEMFIGKSIDDPSVV